MNHKVYINIFIFRKVNVNTTTKILRFRIKFSIKFTLYYYNISVFIPGFDKEFYR